MTLAKSRIKIVEVPDAFRPQTGSRAVSFTRVAQQAETARQASVAQAHGVLTGLVQKLAAAAEAQHEDASQNLRRLMRRANDVRGLAAMLEAGLIADISDAIFRLAESAQTSPLSSISLIHLLAQCCLRLLEGEGAENPGLEAEVRAILNNLRVRE